MSWTRICGYLPHTSAKDTPLFKLFTCQSAANFPTCHKSHSSSIPISQAPLTDRNVYICAKVRRQYAGRCPSSARAALDFGVYINYNAHTAGLSGYQLYHRLTTSAARRKKTLRDWRRVFHLADRSSVAVFTYHHQDQGTQTRRRHHRR